MPELGGRMEKKEGGRATLPPTDARPGGETQRLPQQGATPWRNHVPSPTDQLPGAHGAGYVARNNTVPCESSLGPGGFDTSFSNAAR